MQSIFDMQLGMQHDVRACRRVFYSNLTCFRAHVRRSMQEGALKITVNLSGYKLNTRNFW